MVAEARPHQDPPTLKRRGPSKYQDPWGYSQLGCNPDQEAPCRVVVYAWAFKRLPYHCFGVHAYTISKDTWSLRET